MGIGPKISRDSYPSKSLFGGKVSGNCYPGLNDDSDMGPNYGDKLLNKPDINPQPDNWNIIKTKTLYNSVIVLMNYPNCTNYEGNKILVYYDKTADPLMRLLNQKLIDPHFSENEKFMSPVARFEPTDRGWDMAVTFAEALSSIDQLEKRGKYAF